MYAADYDYYYGYDSYDYAMDYYTYDMDTYGYDDYYYGYDDFYYGGEDYYYGEGEGEEQYPGFNQGSGSNMDDTWYQINSWGQTWSNQTCAINADCDGGYTQCCVSLMITDAEGWAEQTFRCQTAAMVDADMSQTHEMDDGTTVEFTMKCLESGSAYIRAGLLAIALMLSVAF